MRSRNLFIVGAIVLSVGILFGFISLNLYSTQRDFLKVSKKTEAKVVEISDNKKDIYIEYYVDGKLYKEKYKPKEDMYIGREVEIYYKTSDPSKFKDVDFKITTKVYFILAIILGLVGIFICMFAVDKKIRNKKERAY